MSDTGTGTGTGTGTDTDTADAAIGTDTGDSSSVLSRRRRWVAVVAAGAVVLAGAGLGASVLIKSPAQAAADAKAPPPDTLTSPVEHRVLKDSVILRGTVTAGQTVDVSPGTVGGESGARPVVTKLPVQQGRTVAAGKVVLEVSGRPVFVLKGSLPVYRDLKPGTEGNDVKQLQQALASLGHSSGSDTAGLFGEGTKAALNSFYRSIGYDPLPASAEGDTEIEAAQDAVTAAERAHQDARDALSEASSSTPSAPAPSASESTSESTSGNDGSGNGGGSDDGKSGSGDTKSLRKAVDRSAEDLAKARESLARTQRKAGPMLPSGEVVFVGGFPARVTQVSSVVGSPADGVAMKLSAGRLVVHGYLQDQQKGLIRPGQKVQIVSEISGVTSSASVSSVADTRNTAGAPQGQGQGQDSGATAGSGGGAETAETPDGYLMVVRPGRALPPKLAGEDVRLTIEAGTTAGKALVVPVTALSSGSDGTSVVTVLEDGGKQRRVTVRPGTSGDGFVAVTPVAGAVLKEGDKVITGVKRGSGT